MAAKKAVRATRTRTENHKAAQEVLAAAQERDTTSPEETKVATARVAALKDSTKNVSIEVEAKNLTQVSLDIASKIQGLQTELSKEIEKLNAVKESRAIYEAELEELGRKDVITTELKALADEHTTKVDQYTKEIEELQAKVAAQSEENDSEQDKYETERDEERQREEKEYNYNLAQTRKQEQDKFNQQVAQQKYAENERQRDFTKAMNEREAKIAAAEKELVDLRAQVASFPEQLKKEGDKSAAIVGNTMKKDHANELALIKKDMESAARVSAIELGSVKQTVIDLTAQLTQAKTDLKDAQTKVAEIANKALEASSGQGELSTLRQALQNGGNNQTNGRPSKQ